MNTINPLYRTINKIIETNMPNLSGENLKAFQLVKYVTGNKINNHTDYECIFGKHHNSDCITLKGKRGFIKFTLTPLFQEIE